MDERFVSLRSHLAPPDWGEDVPHATGDAAVAMIFRSTPEMEVLLVRRSISERDPWSGHMALPGGRRDATDASILHTAIRETHEETGLEITEQAALGRLPPVSPQTRRVPTVRVTPFVFGVPGEAVATVASPEIDSVFWVGLNELRDPDNHSVVGIPLIGTVREFPAYRVQGQVVWGLTYRILSRFLGQIVRWGETDTLQGW